MLSVDLLKSGRMFLVALWALLLINSQANAALTIEITKGQQGALPIAVIPFGWQGPAPYPPQNVAAIIANDLTISGRFSPLEEKDLIARPTEGRQVNFRDWRLLGAPNIVVGKVIAEGDRYKVQFQLFDVYREIQQVGFSFEASGKDLRRLAHKISDLIYETLTGERGAFATRIAYIKAKDGQAGRMYSLFVADVDGHDAQLIVRSRHPLMSPSWSPDGTRLAYVSFENGRSMIYVQNVLTGERERVSAFKGINGAPTWSPDGKRLAMSLSKDGNSEIYVMHLGSKRLRRLTNHYAIDTEPTWSPSGDSIAFTSDRGGRPQIYQISAQGGGKAERLTYDGRQNLNPVYSPDGKRLAMIRGEGGSYRVAVMDLENKMTQILTDARLDESPSFAPNGSMVIYATEYMGRGVLSAVSVDGRVQQRIGLQEGGDAREPAWGPFLSNK